MALKSDDMKGFRSESREDVLKIIYSTFSEGFGVSEGYSHTSRDVGVSDYPDTRYRHYHYDKFNPKGSYDIFTVHAFFFGVNIIMEGGDIYKADGSGNGFAPIMRNPEKTISVV